MAIDFPNSPSVDQQYTVGDRTWTWNGSYWALTLTSSTFTASDNPPSGASAGDFWFESDTGKTFVYYDSYWVEVAGRAGSTTITSSGSSVSVSGADGEIQYASSGSLASSTSFTWDNASTALTIAGNIVANNVTANANIVADSIKIDSGGTPIYLNGQTVSADYTIPANYNGMSAGPITIANGVTVTITSGSEWSIV